MTPEMVLVLWWAFVVSTCAVVGSAVVIAIVVAIARVHAWGCLREADDLAKHAIATAQRELAVRQIREEAQR